MQGWSRRSTWINEICLGAIGRSNRRVHSQTTRYFTLRCGLKATVTATTLFSVQIARPASQTRATIVESINPSPPAISWFLAGANVLLANLTDQGSRSI